MEKATFRCCSSSGVSEVLCLDQEVLTLAHEGGPVNGIFCLMEKSATHLVPHALVELRECIVAWQERAGGQLAEHDGVSLDYCIFDGLLEIEHTLEAQGWGLCSITLDRDDAMRFLKFIEYAVHVAPQPKYAAMAFGLQGRQPHDGDRG